MGLLLAYLSLFVFGFVDNARGPVFPDVIQEFKLSDTAGAWFFFSASASMLFNNIVLFNWMERNGAFRTLQVYSVVQAIGLLIMGIGATYPVTIAGSVVLGLSLGGLGIAVNVLVAEGAPVDRRRQWLAGLHCMYGISSLLSPLWINLVHGLGHGWREALLWLAVAPLAVYGLSVLKPSQVHPGNSSRSQTEVARPQREALFFAVLCTLYVIAEISVSTRLVLFVRRDWNYSIEAANGLLSLYFLGLFSGRLAFALLRLPWRSRTILRWSAVFGAVTYGLGIIVNPFWLAAAGLSFSVFYPCAIALMSDEHGAKGGIGYITSWCITLQALGLMAMHFFLGSVADAFGLKVALWIGPIALLAVLILLSHRKRV